MRKKLGHWMGGWMDGWMGGVERKAGLRIAYINQNENIISFHMMQLEYVKKCIF